MAVITVAFSDLDTWLQAQPDNTADTPYEIEITGLDSTNYRGIKDILVTNGTKYVSLAPTTMPTPDSSWHFSETFKNCTTLVYPPVIPYYYNCSWRECFYGCTALKETPSFPNAISYMDSAFENCTSLEIAHPIGTITYNSGTNNTFKNCISLLRKPYDTYGIVTITSNTTFDGVPTNDWVIKEANYTTFMDDVIPSQNAVINVYVEDLQRTFFCMKMSKFGSWLEERSSNTVSTPYYVGISANTSDNYGLIKQALVANPTKYVDLRYTTFRVITNESGTFSNCENMVGAPTLLCDQANVTMYQTFYYCKNLKYVKFDDNRISEAVSMFEGCSSLEEILYKRNNPSWVLTNASSMFEGCIKLKHPILFSKYETLNTNMQRMYQGCTELTLDSTVSSEYLVIPNGVEYLLSTFYGCSSLETPPVIPSSVIQMSMTFAKCTNLAVAPELPSGLEGLYATFSDCENLETPPIIPPSAQGMTGVFSNCSKLKTPPVLPNGTELLDSTFKGCSSLEYFPAIPSGVTSMLYAFEGCIKARNTRSIKLSIPSSVTKGEFAFKNCALLERIDEFKIPLSALDSSNFQNMFLGCSSLVQIGHKSALSDSWHVMSLNISSNTVSGKIYDSEGNDTEINEGTAVSITKDTLSLPNLTDEILFPPSSLSDADLEDTILDVIENKYTYWKKIALDPTKKSFVIYADDPDNFVTNLLITDVEKITVSSNSALTITKETRVFCNATNITLTLNYNSKNRCAVEVFAIQDCTLKYYTDANTTETLTMEANTMAMLVYFNGWKYHGIYGAVWN